MELQKAFKHTYLAEMKDRLMSGTSLPLYSANEFVLDNPQLKRIVGIYPPDGLSDRMLQAADNDFEAAVILYEAYQNITPITAISEEFWAYLTHTSLYQYTQNRWPKVKEPDCTSQYVLDHWFLDQPGRALRNSGASLWWSIHNTIDSTRKNKYELSEILFKNYTLRVVNFGSYQLIRHREAMIGILQFLKDNPIILNNNLEVRNRFIFKYFNRLGAVKQLAYLDRDYFYNTCVNIKDKILSITSYEDLEDNSLYNEIF